MNLHTQILLNEYKENLKTYEKIKEIALEQLKGIAKSFKIEVNSIEGRVKTEKSLTGKLELKGEKYKNIFDLTDIFGARVVTFYSTDIDLIAAKITEVFNIDWENSIDKRKIHKIDQFGYMSLHYICSIPTELFSSDEYPNLNNVRFEIQLRTVLQHAWASIYHDTGYKDDVEVPSEYLRSLNRLAGLLEIADQEFSSVKEKLSEYRRHVLELVASGKLEELEFTIDSYNAFIDKGVFEKLNKKISMINNMDIEYVPDRKLFVAFKNLGLQTLKDLNDMLTNYGDYAYKFCIHQFEGTDIDIISNLTGPTSLIFVYALDKGVKEEGIESILESIYGPRRSNKSFAKKVVSIGRTMGLTKED